MQLGQRQRDRAQEALYKHLKQSHLNNGEHNLFMAAAMGHDPASLVLGHMNREAFGTSPNCTTALAYYLAVLKRTLFEPYSPKLVLDLAENMEDHLYARKQLELQEQERDDHSFVMDTAYFDEETISATLEQANRFYTGSRGVLRDLERALKLFEKLSHQGNLDGKIMAGLMYFRGEGTLRDVGKARHLFEQTRKDEVSEYMLIVMDYFEMIGAGTRPRAIRTIRGTPILIETYSKTTLPTKNCPTSWASSSEPSPSKANSPKSRRKRPFCWWTDQLLRATRQLGY